MIFKFLVKEKIFIAFNAIVNKKPSQSITKQGLNKLSGGELGIRTPGPVTVNSFQDCRNRPLCQLSAAKIGFANNKKNILLKTLKND